MKKILLIATAALITTVSAAQKMAHLNSTLIIVQTNEYKTAQEEIMRYSQQKQTQLQQMQQTIIAEEEKMQKEGASLPAEIKKSRQKDLDEMKQSFQTFYSKAEKDVANKEQDLLNPISVKVQEAINKVCEANGYTYVFDIGKGALAYISKDAKDISKLIADELKVTEFIPTMEELSKKMGAQLPAGGQ